MITAFSKIIYLLRSTLLLQKIPDYNDQKGLLYPVILASLKLLATRKFNKYYLL